MDIKEAIRSGLKEFILPELDSIKNENREISIKLDMTNKRLDDINLHLVDQSRRIDETNNRIDETNNRLNRLYEVIVRREEHEKLEWRVIRLEEDVTFLKEKITA
ncbi:MAG: hypothetical protein HY999_02555 [Nitrospinae bacterium]|nr:hypothetical protein [Nitrospinota bacterium]